MAYVEFLRVRKALVIYCSIIAIALMTSLISVHAAHVHHEPGKDVTLQIDSKGAASGSHGSDTVQHELSGTMVPLGVLFVVAGYIAMVFAMSLGANLNKENDRGGFAFTKPISRGRLALTNIAIDFAAIVVAFVFAFAVELVAIGSFGLLGNVRSEADDVVVLLLAFGAGLMWYGVLQAVTAGLRGGGGRFVGFSWGFFFLLELLAGVTLLGPIFHTIVMVLNVINPFAYMTQIDASAKDATVGIQSLFDISLQGRAAMTWGIALIGCAIAVGAWKRVEV